MNYVVESDCGHWQGLPTGVEIENCPEVIVRKCGVCGAALWWNVDRWRAAVRGAYGGRVAS